MPEPQLRKVRVNGAELAYFERNQRDPAKPTLLFAHATGFHGRIWDRIIGPLGDYHSIALEQRGHGRSEKLKVNHWNLVGDDLAGVIQTLGLTDLIGVGHSMGAHAIVDAAATGAFARMVLLDPTITDPDAYLNPTPFQFEGGVHPVAKRRNAFASVEEMMERLANKSAFPLFDRQTFRDYCQHGLLEAPGGGLQLACPPEIEASVYMSTRSNARIFDRIAAIDAPVLIVRAKAPVGERGVMDFASSPTWPGLVHRFRNGREIYRRDITHFIPMQIPDEIIRIIREEVAAWGEDQRRSDRQPPNATKVPSA